MINYLLTITHQHNFYITWLTYCLKLKGKLKLMIKIKLSM